MKSGTIIPKATGVPVEVEYELWVRGRDDAGGSIRIDEDPTPSEQFLGNPALSAPGNVTCILKTASGVEVSIFFTNATGIFVCQSADQAKEAIKAGG